MNDENVKFCKKCNSYKSNNEFYKNKNICKRCWNKRELQYRANREKNIKGERLQIDEDTDKKYENYSKSIEKELYNENRNFNYTIEDLEDEVYSLIDYFSRNLTSCLEERKSIIENADNNKKLKNILNDIEIKINKFKEMYIYE